MTWVAIAVVAIVLLSILRRKQEEGTTATLPAPDVPHDESGIRQLIARGQPIQAIKLVRELTDLGLKESKDLVDALARGENATIPARRMDAGSVTALLSAARDSEVHALLRKGDRIGAIKRWRALTGGSLAEAHDAIETLARGLPGAPGGQ